MSKPFSTISILVLMGAQVALAELEWKATSQNITVHPLQTSTTVPFGFANSGEEPVTILNLKPSCGCITGKVAKKTYAPGEAGTVMVAFNLKGRLGAQHKGIAVVTDDQPSKPTHLYIDTNIPRTYESAIKRITWASGENHDPKTFRLINASKTSFPLEKVVPSRDGVTVELKSIHDGYEYDLVITPAVDLKSTLVPIVIYPEKPEDLDSIKTFTVYALVK